MEPVNPNPNLICTICFDIIKTAIQTPCGHVFCLSCLMKWTFYQVQPTVEFWLEGAPSNTCPTCRSPYEPYLTSLILVLDRIISEIPYQCMDCKEIMSQNLTDKHKCKHLFHCSLGECNFSSKDLDDLLYHQNYYCLHSSTLCNICFESCSLAEYLPHKQKCVIKFLRG